MAPRDDFPSRGSTDSATIHFIITPSAEPLAIIPRALRVIAAGDLAIRDVVGTDITYPVSVGEVILFKGTHVLPETTATVAGWL